MVVAITLNRNVIRSKLKSASSVLEMLLNAFLCDLCQVPTGYRRPPE